MRRSKEKVRQTLNELILAVVSHGHCPVDVGAEEPREKCGRCGAVDGVERDTFRIGQCWRAWKARRTPGSEEYGGDPTDEFNGHRLAEPDPVAVKEALSALVLEYRAAEGTASWADFIEAVDALVPEVEGGE